jgi:Ni/Co efflux regulator RcnB
VGILPIAGEITLEDNPAPNSFSGRPIMKRLTVKMPHLLALLCAGMFAAGSTFADKPSWAGKPDKQEQKREGQPDAPRAEGAGSMGMHFGDQQRAIVQDYYAGQFRKGRCPPGLAKKQNGCMPPGQAKKWAMGKPLPSDVTFYDLPPRLARELGTPPAGHRYVRVAADILLIAVGTSMVVDAIEDLGRM